MYKTQQYVCFNQKTGEIYSIGPSIEEGYQYIEVEDEDIEPIKSYKEKMTDYRVVYNRKEKMFVLKKLSTVSDEIAFRKLKKLQKNSTYDVLLEIDKANKLCYISTDYELLDTINQKNVDFSKDISFSITEKNNPHVLYDLVHFNIGENIKHPISELENFSVYTDSDVADCVYLEI